MFLLRSFHRLLQPQSPNERIEVVEHNFTDETSYEEAQSEDQSIEESSDEGDSSVRTGNGKINSKRQIPLHSGNTSRLKNS